MYNNGLFDRLEKKKTIDEIAEEGNNYRDYEDICRFLSFVYPFYRTPYDTKGVASQ